MRKNTSDKGQSALQQGSVALAEAAHLFRQMRFSYDHGAYAEGQHVAISVDPRWNVDRQTLCVLITCYAFGHNRIKWSSLPVYVLPEGGKAGVRVIARLDARGQTVIPSLPAGDYTLSLRLTPQRADLVLSDKPERLAAQGEDEQDERRLWRGSSENDALIWTIEETEEGDVQIAFETHEERLAGSVVVFSLVELNSKHVHSSHRLTLEPTRTAGTWEGWCSVGSRAHLHGPYELVFEVVSPNETG
jgi:hypothetical protein